MREHGVKGKMRFEIHNNDIDMILEGEVKIANPTTEMWFGYVVLTKNEEGELTELHRQGINFPPGTMMTLGSSS